jgi:AI-2 transport protein TqsA
MTIRNMANDPAPPLLRVLLGGASAVIILWGVKIFSEILGPLLLGVNLAWAVAPFPQWLMRRFRLSRGRAATVMAVTLGATMVLTIVAVELGVARLATRLPVYQQGLTNLYEQVSRSLSSLGIDPTSWSANRVLTPERLSLILPGTGTIIAKGLLIFLLAFLFVIEMLCDREGKSGKFAEYLGRHGHYAQTYVTVIAKSAGINAVFNLVFLLAMGVDEAFLWCFLYVFLDFIPTLGFLIAMVPPAFVTFLVYGWKRALVVACGLILTNVIVDNVVMPIFAQRAMSISFLEITLALVVWSFLLGFPGTVLAIPLTLRCKEVISKMMEPGRLGMEASSG